MGFAYYLNEKYGFFEVDMDEDKVGGCWLGGCPLYMGWFFEELLSKMFRMLPVKVSKPDLEVDIALRDHRRIGGCRGGEVAENG